MKLRHGVALVAAMMTGLVFTTPSSHASSVVVDVVADNVVAENNPFADDSYIVNVIDTYSLESVLRDYPRIEAAAQLFEQVLHGFAADLTVEEAAKLSRDVRVSSVRKNSQVSLMAPLTRAVTDPGLWGLDRIDERRLGDVDDAIITPDDTPEDVYIYVVDTGVRTTHDEFGIRIDGGYTTYGVDVEDCNGHGTHVSATALGAMYGVAPNALLIPVRVLGCDGKGDIGDVLWGLEQIALDTSRRPAVVNLSLGGGSIPDLDSAVSNLVASGVSVVVAAGNSGANACNTSPARVPAAITVAAIDFLDKESSFSNYGSCVDIFAPGTGILSAWRTGDTDSRVESGTSMAAPHVAGAIALYLDANPSATPDQVWNALRANATVCAVSYYATRTTQSPNRLLYVGNEIGHPCPPRNVAGSVGNVSATVSWSAPEVTGGGAEPLTYTATADQNGASCTTNELSCTVTGLTNGATYSFTVTASNGTLTSTSAVSSPITLYTEPLPPVISRIRTTSRAISVQWDQLQVPYAVTYTTRVVRSSRTCTTTTNNCKVTKLRNGKRYRLTVSATNFVGEGVASPHTWFVVPGMNTLRDQIKRKKRIRVTRFMTTLSRGRTRYSITKGACRISSGYLVAPSRVGKCTLKMSVSASGKYPAMYNTVVVTVT